MTPPDDYLPKLAGGPDQVQDIGEDELPDDHPLLVLVERLLQDYAGAIFVGPPGTSKSYFARLIALKLAGAMARVRFVQFHPSYQYEDFVEGFVPRKDASGFDLKDKTLLHLAEDAEKDPSHRYVVVIDEINRGDPGRIFGEALTYVERTKRGQKFQLASGNERSIPVNIVFLATLNPFDRGVDEVDAAFERRFAKIEMNPDETTLRSFLNTNQMDAALADKVVTFFKAVLAVAKNTPAAAVGHTYFYSASTEDDLRLIWDHQLLFLFRKAFRLDPTGFTTIEDAWRKVVPKQQPEPPAEPPGAEVVQPEGPAPAAPNPAAE